MSHVKSGLPRKLPAFDGHLIVKTSMNILQQPNPIAGVVVRTCSDCPFSRPLGGNRFVCTESCTGSDVVRGHWEPSLDCLSILVKGGV